ncbi:MAG: prepilin-type N-terminal cleavage/methylation domain-containing protein [Candidatus Portnoybacteria bacterium]|nr:prepilin-type N-terminal cleavage/methylation domain-containing protein [Candidatus Portnoybacteria bacterium]
MVVAPEKKNFGFTFVETIISVVIVAIIASVAARVLLAGLDVYKLVVDRNNTFQSSRMAMERMVDELIHLESTDLTWMTNERIGFRDMNGIATDFDMDSVSGSGYTFPCIFRGDDYLVGNVTHLDFDYLNEDGGNTIWSWLVRRINIDFTVEAPRGAGALRLRTDVFPRRFMYTDFE